MSEITNDEKLYSDVLSRVYVACLGCYNECSTLTEYGTLRGTHMTSEQLSDAWRGDGLLANICDAPNHDEWAIHDYDGPIARCGLGEHPDIEGLITLMETIDSDPATMVAAFLLAENIIGSIPTAEQTQDVSERMEVIEDAGEWAEEWARDCCGKELDAVPSWITQRIDWRGAGQEILTYDYYTYQYGDYTYALHTGEGVGE